MNNKNSVKTVVAVAIGAALFFVLGRFVAIPHAVAWIGVAPVLDILIYAEPVDKVFAQGAMAAVANILTAVIVGALLIAAYTKTIAKKGSLEKQ